MLRNVIFAASFFLFVTLGGFALAKSPHIRIDATSVASAEASFKRMHSALPTEKKKKLIMAVVAINLVGVNSAIEVVNSPELQRLTVGRIKDQIADMTADEILEYAAKHSTVTMEVVMR